MEYCFMRFPNGKGKAVTLSYDDGCKWDKKLSDIVTSYGMKCTFNLCSEIIGKNEWQLTEDEVKEYILDRGHEVAIHGANHRANGMQRITAGITETLDCRRDLERKFGIIIKGMAYPDTGINHIEGYTSYEKIKQNLSDIGIVYARSAINEGCDSFLVPVDWHKWMPTVFHLSDKLFEFVDKFNSFEIDNRYKTRRYPRLFYMWGHSHELERQQKWDIFEKFCGEIGGKEDVWYATNMEIYEYTNAYNSLVFNVDETLVYNPSLFEIWFCADGKMCSVKPGEKILL